jgi:hypothetical protein
MIHHTSKLCSGIIQSKAWYTFIPKAQQLETMLRQRSLVQITPSRSHWVKLTYQKIYIS